MNGSSITPINLHTFLNKIRNPMISSIHGNMTMWMTLSIFLNINISCFWSTFSISLNPIFTKILFEWYIYAEFCLRNLKPPFSNAFATYFAHAPLIVNLLRFLLNTQLILKYSFFPFNFNKLFSSFLSHGNKNSLLIT